jgi:hypothetical protein
MNFLKSLFPRFFGRDNTIRDRRFILGQFGKTQVELEQYKSLLILGNNSSGRMDIALELSRQAIAQNFSLLFIDTMQDVDTVNKLAYFAKRVRREKEFYVKGAFNATPAHLPDVVKNGDILYCGPSETADSPEAYSAETGPLLADLSVTLMNRVADPKSNHMVIVMVDVLEAFGEFPQQIKTLPSLLRSLNMTLICVECSDTYRGTELEAKLDCIIKMQYEGDVPVCTPVGMPQLLDLADGEALVSMRNARYDIGPVILAQHEFEMLPVPSAKAVNMTSAKIHAEPTFEITE